MFIAMGNAAGSRRRRYNLGIPLSAAATTATATTAAATTAAAASIAQRRIVTRIGVVQLVSNRHARAARRAGELPILVFTIYDPEIRGGASIRP